MNTTTISAADFIDRIMTGGRFHVGERYVVVGEVSLRGAILQTPLLLHGFLFEGPVDFSDTVVPGELDFSDCRFRRNLRLSQMHVQGSVRFRRVQIDVEARERDGSDGMAIEADGLEADGDFRVEELNCQGGVTAAGLTVAGRVTWQSIGIQNNLDLSDGRFGGQLNMTECKIGGGLDMLALSVQSYANFDRVEVAHYCNLSSSKIDEGLYIASTRIEGVLHVANSRMAALQIERADAQVSGSHFGAITAYGMELALGFKLCGATLGPHPHDVSEAVLALGRMKADHIQFWYPPAYWSAILSIKEENDEQRRKASNSMLTYVDGNIEMDAVTVVQRVDLTGLLAKGDVSITNSHIGGDLLACSSLTLQSKPTSRRMAGTILHRAAEGEGGAGAPRPTMLYSLNIKDSRIGTDIDLTGLDLKQGLNARHTTVGGTVMLADTRNGLPEACMNCPGRADFSGANIYKLQASGSSFQDTGADTGGLETGLILDDAEVTLLRLFPKRGQGRGQTYPRPLGVGNLTVRHWKLLDDENADFRSESDEAKTFLRLLENDPRISRTTYLSIVSTLRNQGHERASSMVFRGLSWRTLGISIRQTLGRLSPRRLIYLPVQAASWLLNAIYGVLLGFGTAPLRLAALILAVGLVSYVSVYNLDTNLEKRVSMEGEVARFTAATGDAACTDWQKALVMLRHHIPVAVSEESETCRLRPHGMADAAPPIWFGADVPIAKWPFSPLEFGLYMRLLALMLWPPFLAFALKRAFRE